MNQKNSAFIWLLSIPAIFALWQYIYLGSYSRLLGDSFCSFYRAERHGFFQSIWYWRLNWSGRYSAYAVDWFAWKIFGASGIGWIPPLLLILWLLAVIVSAYYVLRSIPAAFLFGNILLALIFALNPSVEQSFFWFDGARSYFIPLAGLAIFFALHKAFTESLKQKTGRLLPIALAFTLFFINSGFSETFAVFQFCLIFFLLLYQWITGPRKDFDSYLLAAAWIGTFVALIVIISAPGNAIRQKVSPPTPALMDIIRISLTGYLSLLADIFSTPKYIVALISSALASFWLGANYGRTFAKQYKKIGLFILGAIALSFVCIPPGVYGYGEMPPSRVMVIPLSALCLFMLSAAFLFGANYSMPAIGNRALVIIAFAGMTYSTFIVSQNYIANRNIYIEFAEKWDAVDVQIREAQMGGATEVTIPALDNWAFVDRPISNPNFWANQCYTRYYGITVLAPPY